MKTLFMSFAAFLLVCNIASAQIIKVELQAAGLTCSMCSRAVDKQLRTLDFIDSVEIDLSRAMFVLYFKKDKALDFDKVRQKVEDAGFSVALFRIHYWFENYSMKSNSILSYRNINFSFKDVVPRIIKDGHWSFRIIDKGFLSDKEYKKYKGQIGEEKSTPGKIIYHVL